MTEDSVQNARPIGDWVAIEVLPITKSGTIHLPGSHKAPDILFGVVRSISPDILNPPFEVGSVVVAEIQSGHPFVGMEPDPTRGHFHTSSMAISDLAQIWKGRNVGLVPYFSDTARAPQKDSEATKRQDRVEAIIEIERKRQEHMDLEPDPQRLTEMQQHSEWIGAYVEDRKLCHRSKFYSRIMDEAKGRGIIAIVDDVQTLIDVGVDPTLLLDELEQ